MYILIISLATNWVNNNNDNGNNNDNSNNLFLVHHNILNALTTTKFKGIAKN